MEKGTRLKEILPSEVEKFRKAQIRIMDIVYQAFELNNINMSEGATACYNMFLHIVTDGNVPTSDIEELLKIGINRIKKERGED